MKPTYIKIYKSQRAAEKKRNVYQNLKSTQKAILNYFLIQNLAAKQKILAKQGILLELCKHAQYSAWKLENFQLNFDFQFLFSKKTKNPNEISNVRTFGECSNVADEHWKATFERILHHDYFLAF